MFHDLTFIYLGQFSSYFNKKTVRIKVICGLWPCDYDLMIIGEVPESLRLMIFYFFFRISESVKIGAHLLTLGSVKFIGQSWWSSGVISQTSSTLQFCCTYYGYRTLTLLYDVLRFKINVCSVIVLCILFIFPIGYVSIYIRQVLINGLSVIEFFYLRIIEF